MDEQSTEQQIWDRLEDIRGWNYIATPYMKDDAPSLGMLPASLALSIGDSKILFASGEVSEVDPINGFERFRVDVTFVTSNGIHELSTVVGRQEFGNPTVSWSPLVAIKSVTLESSKNWWSGNPDRFGLTLKLDLRGERVVRLVPGGTSLNTAEALVSTYREIQSQAGR